MINTKLRMAAQGGRAAALLLAIAAGPASAAEPSNYAGVHLGANDLSSWPATVDFGADVRVDGRLDLDRGAHGGVMFGRQTERARFELEYQHGQAAIQSATLGPRSQSANGTARYDVLTVNAYRTQPITERFGVFAGLGLGWGSVTLPRLAPFNGCNCFSQAKRTGFVYQLRVGGEFDVSARDHVFLQYTSVRLPAPNAGGAPSIAYARRTAGVVGVGWRHNF